MRFGLGVVAVVLAGCGAKGDEEQAPAPSCPAGQTLQADGTCKAEMMPPKSCVAGELELADKSCQPAGVAPGGCGKGFTADGKGGCDPVLPAMACAAGQLAVPGDAACHELSPCGAGPYPDVPADAKVQRVDGSYKGGGSDGSSAKPWTTIQQAVAASEAGGVVAIAAGSYAESVAIAKPVRLWGRCAAQVTISGKPAVAVANAAAASEIKGVAISGAGIGIDAQGAKDLTIEAVWIHDTAAEGVSLRGGSATVRATLIEGATGYGASLAGAGAVVESSAVRGIKAGKFITAGIEANRDGGAKLDSHLTVRGSLIEKVPADGIRATSTELLVEASLIRDITPVTDNDGEAIYAQSNDNPETVTVRSSVLDRPGSHGVYAGKLAVTVENTVIRGGKQTDPLTLAAGIEAGSELLSKGKLQVALKSSLIADFDANGVVLWGGGGTIDGLAVRDIHLDPDGLATGIGLRNDLDDGGPGSVDVHGSLVERSASTGIVVANSNATIDRTAVRDIAPAGPTFGEGILASGFGKQPAKLTLTRSLVDGAREVGVWALGGQVVVEDSAIQALRPDMDGVAAGAAADDAPIGKTTTPASLTLRRVTIDGAVGYGVGIFHKSAAVIEDSVIRNTAANGMVQGDGVSVISSDATAKVTGTKIEHSARAAIAAFGAKVSIGGSSLSCQSFDLDGEPFMGQNHSFDDLGDNACGCPDAKSGCHATSEKLAPPDPLPPPSGT